MPGIRAPLPKTILRTGALIGMLVLAFASGGVAIETQIDPGPSAGQVVLGADPVTGHVFAVVRWGNDWGVFFSSNHGVTWSETYTYDGFLQPSAKVDLAVEGGYAYVANAHGSLTGSYVAAIRRFDATTGARDEDWGAHTVRTEETYSISGIGLEVMESGSIFYLIQLSSHAVLCYVGQTSNGGAWATEPTLISDADRGLDVQHPGDYDDFTDGVLLYVSYVSTSDAVSLSRLHQNFDFSSPVTVSYESAADKTSIAAHGRHVVVAWEYQGDSHQGVRSMVAKELPAEDLEWTLWPEWESGSSHLYDPRAAVERDSYRNAMIYESATQILYREHLGWGDTWGSTVTPINGHAFTPGEGDRYAFEWMLEGFAVAYLGSAGDVWFSYPDLVFADGFESSDSSVWSSSVP